MRSYGTVRLIEGRWCIKCEPHVMIRLKRVFDGISKAQHGSVSIPDTPEFAYELAWFLKRYPMAVSHAAELAAQVTIYERRAALVNQVLNDPNYTPPDFDLALPAREYQRAAADLVLKNGHLLLADDVGIGKTISGICILKDPRALPALVVTLTHLPRQWQSELARFAPTLRTHVLKKGTPYDLERGYRGKREPFPDVIISNYHKLHGWADTLAGVAKSVIFDEIQELRRSGEPGNESLKYAAAKHIAHSAQFRLGLSATPIYNYGGEFFNVLHVLAPQQVGTKHEFLREWCTNIIGDKPRIDDPKAFGAYVRDEGLMLRRTRADVGRELPPLTEVPQEIDADITAIDRVAPDLAELCNAVLSADGVDKKERLRMSGEIDWKLRQATGMAKAPYVAQFVRLLVESGEQVVLYGWHHGVYDIWRELLHDLGPVFYTGKQSATQKDAAKQAFIAGQSKVLVMSLRSGAGLDGLQGHARTVVFGELDWSPGVHEQCIGRVHRDGQGDAVVAYYMFTDVGSDPVIIDALGIKTAQVKGVTDPDTAMVKKMDRGGAHIRRLAEDFLRRHAKGLTPRPAGAVNRPAPTPAPPPREDSTQGVLW